VKGDEAEMKGDEGRWREMERDEAEKKGDEGR